MTRARRVLAALTVTGLIGLASTPGAIAAAGPTPGMRLALPSAQPAPWKPTPSPAAPAPAARASAAPKAAAPLAVVALPLDLKDPYTAYSLGMIPFASSLAARYVGTHRLSWHISDELSGAATRQALMDWGLLVGGAAIMGFTTAMPYNMQGQGVFVGAGALLAIPVSHWLLYAPYWGEEAVRLNRGELARHGFPLDAPAPLILAPVE